jgi:hypothetical protein
MSVYKSINAVQAALARTGISKANRNQAQGYNFRGIDDCYNALSPLLAEHGLCILPRVLARTVVEHPSKNGGVLFYVTVEVEFDFVCAEDGSKHTVKTFGEAMDSGDKATNKAMSAAYKYAVMQAFAIPTEGDNDADAHTHEIADPRRASFLADTKAAIDGAANAGELKRIVAETLGKANSLNDVNAVATITAWAEAKAAKAKPKTKQEEVTA